MPQKDTTKGCVYADMIDTLKYVCTMVFAQAGCASVLKLCRNACSLLLQDFARDRSWRFIMFSARMPAAS